VVSIGWYRLVSSFVLVTALLALAVLVSSSTRAILYFYPIFDVRSSLTIDKKVETLCSSAHRYSSLLSDGRIIELSLDSNSAPTTRYLIESRFSLLTRTDGTTRRLRIIMSLARARSTKGVVVGARSLPPGCVKLTGVENPRYDFNLRACFEDSNRKNEVTDTEATSGKLLGSQFWLLNHCRRCNYDFIYIVCVSKSSVQTIACCTNNKHASVCQCELS